ncbi:MULTISPECIES: MEKHLA domain-containing protein [Methylobacterium]|uniref:MEKHLA domain-containing protein n=1 Tax=Methylobacterium jeotgali TaxID=381630 RepID=A0ABQ4STX7_9HYPH|nr:MULTISPECIES: MEKHLA domain-containing protein [Methylobacterium]PIU07913.1 MAG: MEKHLA domain-containing protein [Methylobacterium sp. CG09_land_8_20_14_0_10_71_15]PIU13723.1 MAG: MEKHLA domain-containing protein [Methylobacterium sp. CG08_land_8_20_14_0_20_71_15]GBU17054.1 MEKHLA domain-containing protein [Methylobacterium sp.]GJE06675.1 hypothetical protein AOPFMNJM_1997 [Methylobacterium jeotgali]
MPSDPLDPAVHALLTESFRRLVGRPLEPEGEGGPDWLYRQAPFAVLAHDTGADPRFVYANRAAQGCFGYDWDAFLGMPSRLSAEAPERAERQRLLDAVARDGFVSGYAGIRVDAAGRRFPIAEGIVWQLIGEDGAVRGQAATFPVPADRR